MLHAGGDETELRGMVDEDQDLCSLLIRLQDHHWRIHSADVEVLLRPDGSDFLIGEGAHAKVLAFAWLAKRHRFVLNFVKNQT